MYIADYRPKCVNHVLTDMGWFDVVHNDDGTSRMILSEIADGTSMKSLKTRQSLKCRRFKTIALIFMSTLNSLLSSLPAVDQL